MCQKNSKIKATVRLFYLVKQESCKRKHINKIILLLSAGLYVP